MPKLPIDYSRTLIYKIEHIENESLVYVGHTTNWDKRKGQHKYSSNNEKSKEYNRKLYQMIRNSGGWINFKMIEIMKYPCNDKREAEKREDELMKELQANMNTYNSYITEENRKDYLKEYRQVNKEKIKEKYTNNKEKFQEKRKQYNQKNKDHQKEYNKQYREENNEELKEYERTYYKKNKDKKKEYKRNYYEENKDKLKKEMKEHRIKKMEKLKSITKLE